MKKVFALWLLSFWFIAVAYGDEVQEVEKSKGSVKKEIVCKNGSYWVKELKDGSDNWVGQFNIECFNKNGRAECFVTDRNEYSNDRVNTTMFKLFFDTWLVNKDRAISVSKWFEEELDKLYKENCKEVEF